MEDFAEQAATLSVNRGLIAIDYELHETRGKTRNARRRIDLDATTLRVLTAWREWLRAEQRAAGIETAGWMFSVSNGEPIHPTPSRSPSSASPDAPACRSSGCTACATHGTLLISPAIPVEVVSERLGHAPPAVTIDTYQHVMPGCRPMPPARSSDCWPIGRPAVGELGEDPGEAAEEEGVKTVESPGRYVPWPGLLRRGDGI